MNAKNKIKVLFLSAVPRDEDYLDIHREIREIQEKIRKSGRKLELTNLIDVEDGVYKYNTPLFISTLAGSESETVAKALAEEIRG